MAERLSAMCSVQTDMMDAKFRCRLALLEIVAQAEHRHVDVAVLREELLDMPRARQSVRRPAYRDRPSTISPYIRFREAR